MKFLIVLAVICGIQFSEAFDVRTCITDAADAANASAGGNIEGFEQWRLTVFGRVTFYVHARNVICPSLARNNPPTPADIARIESCRNDYQNSLLNDLEKLANDLANVPGGSQEISDQFMRDVRVCLAQQ